MMFIIGGSGAELPAGQAGRRRRGGRAGAPGGRGGGRRGSWREAAPAPPPQLSFPSKGRERVGRAERRNASERPGRRACLVLSAAVNVGAGRDAGPFRSRVRPLTSAPAATGEQETNGLTFQPCATQSPAEEASAGCGRSLYRGFRGNSDPFRTAGGMAGSALGSVGCSEGARLEAAAVLRVCS